MLNVKYNRIIKGRGKSPGKDKKMKKTITEIRSELLKNAASNGLTEAAAETGDWNGLVTYIRYDLESSRFLASTLLADNWIADEGDTVVKVCATTGKIDTAQVAYFAAQAIYYR